MTFVLVVAATIPVTASSAAPELRWIAYLRADSGSDFRGSVEVVRSDGKRHRTLIEEGVLAVDLGSAGLLYAAREATVQGHSGPTSSVIIVSVTDGSPKQLHAAKAGTYHYGLAASSYGDVAIIRQVTSQPATPPFLRGGIDALRSTTIPILVPPEGPPGTVGVVPTGEEDSYQLLFTNDPLGELAHVDQVNVFVSGTSAAPETISDPQSQQVSVRRTDGYFFCGASTCFLTWEELGTAYTVGEFGSSDEAATFADSLIPIESLAGSDWRAELEPAQTPELSVRDRNGKVRILETRDGACECGFRPVDWNAQNDRLLVLASTDGDTALQEYPTDGSAKPRKLADGTADRQRRDVLRDAAYGPDGVVALFVEAGGSGTLRQLDGGDVQATDVRAFDIEGSTLAYVKGSGDVIVRDLSTGTEQTVGEEAIDVSVAPDLIAGSGSSRTDANRGDGRLPGVVLVVIGLAGVALLAGAALLLIARRRGLD